MTKKQMIEFSKAALAEFAALPAREKFRLLQEKGTIDENGEVIMGREEAKQEAAAAAAKPAAQSENPSRISA